MSRIAFIGLGNMGAGMAANQAGAGHAVAAFDLSAPALERARSAGCTPAATAADAVADAEVVITMLPAGHHVRQVFTEAVLRHTTPRRPADRLLHHRRGQRPPRSVAKPPRPASPSPTPRSPAASRRRRAAA